MRREEKRREEEELKGDEERSAVYVVVCGEGGFECAVWNEESGEWWIVVT
jgi:uncharacterized cupin superfamily protein